MGKEYQEIDERIQRWIERQRLVFVATAPCSNNGRINCSPKELDEFKSERELLKNWYDNKTAEEMLDYRIERTAVSLHGLPGLDVHTLRDLS